MEKIDLVGTRRSRDRVLTHTLGIPEIGSSTIDARSKRGSTAS